MELIPAVLICDWGKRGTDSKVANLFKNINPEFVIEENTPYAEFWIGTHDNAPNMVKEQNKSLYVVIDENPQYLGLGCVNSFGNKLPFLLKILSIESATSIQVHPNKEQAAQLHAKQPKIYKDENHKPELTVALSPFEVLIGFRPSTEINNFLTVIPELRSLIGIDLCNTYMKNPQEKYLKKCFQALITCTEAKLKNEFENILHRFIDLDKEKRRLQLADLVERLYKQYPNDVGAFVVYFLNYLTLNPLEAIYVDVNEPHSYLSGECVECTACSDNVLRAGFTSKYKDIDSLCVLMNYHGANASSKIFSPVNENSYTVIFKPPITDFALAKIDVPNGASEVALVTRDSATIFVVVSGTAILGKLNLISGTSLFIPASEDACLHEVSKGFLAFRAMVNL